MYSYMNASDLKRGMSVELKTRFTILTNSKAQIFEPGTRGIFERFDTDGQLREMRHIAVVVIEKPNEYTNIICINVGDISPADLQN